MQKVKIYTDGSCLGNPGPGGYAICIVKDNFVTDEDCFSVGEDQTTNNRMELKALILAFSKIAELGITNVEIISDSNYAVDGFNKYLDGWIRNHWINASKQPVSNSDLWQKLAEIKKAIPNIDVLWTKSHNKNSYNDIVDKLARNEARKIQKLYAVTINV